jgi:TM2 domain-containing membrane protein YozV
MPRLTRILLVTLFVTFAVGSLHAIPITVPGKKKNSVKNETSVTTAPTVNTTTTPLPGSGTKTRAELRKELKKFKKENQDAKTPYAGGKSKTLAAVLAFFLGTLGIHSFYMGQTGKGFMQLGATAVGIGLYVIGIGDYISGAGESFPTLALIGYILILAVGVWALVDFVRILTGGLEPEEGFDS